MKRLLAIFLTISSASLLMLSSCKKSDTLITTNGGTPGTLTASTTTPVLDKTKLTDTTYIVNFSFTPPTYNYNAVVTNTLQIDSAGDNWVHPVSVAMNLHVYQQGYSTLNFNNLLLKIVPAGVTSKVNVRIQHALSSTVATYSNVNTLTVKPFNLTSWIYITGAFANWNNPGPGEDSLVSTLGNGVYTGIINFNATGAGANQFLLLPVKGSWTNKYATNDPTSQTPSSTVMYNAPNNFNAPTAPGQYIVTVNLNTNKITFAQADYYSLIGNDFQGQNWDTDNFLKYVNDGTGTWAITIPMIAPSGGGFKIRQDAAWSNSWGGSATAGVLTNNNGANLTITTAGTYKVKFVMPASALGTNITNPLTAGYSITQ